MALVVLLLSPCRWLDDCCRPIEHAMSIIFHERKAFLYDAVFALESSHPEVVAEMLTLGSHIVAVGPDGVARSAGSGNVHWNPAVVNRRSLTRSAGVYYHGARSAASIAIANADSLFLMQNAYTDVLPRKLLEVVVAEPNSPAAEHYRRWIQTCFIVETRRVAEILIAHTGVVDWPPTEWM
eukprot:SAG31_NODE_6617_length_1950_cov_1.607780_1_plen_181_part_00